MSCSSPVNVDNHAPGMQYSIRGTYNDRRGSMGDGVGVSLLLPLSHLVKLSIIPQLSTMDYVTANFVCMGRYVFNNCTQ